MRRVLVLSPHFPPDGGAASHRMRLLAPRLAEYGWEPTVVAVDPRDIGRPTEPELAHLVHGRVRIETVRALGGRSGRFVGVGDLGLRSLRSLYRRSVEILGEGAYGAILITLPPHYTGLLGPMLHRASGLPYLLDYQDPWVSAWGVTVGSGPNGQPDWKSRLSHRIALLAEPFAVRHVGGLSAVSEGTLAGLLERCPALVDLPRAEVPLGGEPLDFEYVRRNPRPNPFFDPSDGRVHFAYVGTLPPAGGRAVMTAFFAALARLFERFPALRASLTFHFLGTSMQSGGEPSEVVLPIAHVAGVGDSVHEHSRRIDYLDALTVLTQANVLLLLGGTEPHYTPSRVYPALLSGCPLLAVYHEASTVCSVLHDQGRPDRTHLVTFGDEPTGSPVVERIARALEALALEDPRSAIAPAAPLLGDWTAQALAGRLARCLDKAAGRASGQAGDRD